MFNNLRFTRQIKKHGIPLPCFYFNKISSTNDIAKEWARQDKGNAVFVANTQTKGRGRYDRKFVSYRNKAVLLSYVWKPAMNTDIAALGGYCCLAVCRVLQSYGIQTTIKWPNDVLINGKKVCGILPESIVGDTRYVILGIGININNTVEDFCNLPNATSVLMESKLKHNVNDITVRLIEEITRLTEQYSVDKDSLYKEFCERCQIVGKTITYNVHEGVKKAVVLKINSDCSLQLGNDERLNWGEITIKN